MGGYASNLMLVCVFSNCIFADTDFHSLPFLIGSVYLTFSAADAEKTMHNQKT